MRFGVAILELKFIDYVFYTHFGSGRSHFRTLILVNEFTIKIFPKQKKKNSINSCLNDWLEDDFQSISSCSLKSIDTLS